jgi:hypothetical protein
MSLAATKSSCAAPPVIASGSTKWFIQDGVSLVGVM